MAIPFIKWVGGKRNLLPEIKKHIPETFRSYFEPFCGGGALFFELHSLSHAAYLSDCNSALITTYKVIQMRPKQLIEALKRHKLLHNKEYYYLIRSQHDLSDPIEIAARFIYLNKACFNGLYRVNKKGEFNVPIGSYTNPNILEENNIMECYIVLNTGKVRINNMDYSQINPVRGDLVYFDPPYYDTFTNYSAGMFDEQKQYELSLFFANLVSKGITCILSNSDEPFIRDLYKNFTIHNVQANRSINRGSKINELIITGK